MFTVGSKNLHEVRVVFLCHSSNKSMESFLNKHVRRFTTELYALNEAIEF